MAEVVDILHKLTFETNEDVLQAVNKEFGTQIKQLQELKKQEAEYAALLEKTAATDIKNRKAVELLMQRNKKLQDDINISVGKQIAANDKLSESIQKTGKSLQGVTQAGSQLLREAPAFTFSLQTGILALSNNIPIFTDALKKAKEEGKSATEIFKALGSTVTSFGGILTILISAATILPTILEDVNFAGDENNKITEKAIDLYIEETTKLGLLKTELEGTTVSQERLHEIRDQMVKQFPSLKESLEGEEDLQKRLANAIDLTSQALKDQAFIRAATELLVEANKELLKGELDGMEKFMLALNVSLAGSIEGIFRAVGEAKAGAAAEALADIDRLSRQILEAQEKFRKSGGAALLAPEDKAAEREKLRREREQQREIEKAEKNAQKLRDIIAQFARENRTLDIDAFTLETAKQITDETERQRKELESQPQQRFGFIDYRDPSGKFTTEEIKQGQKDAKAQEEQDKRDAERKQKNRRDAERAAVEGVQTAINALQQVYQAQLHYADLEIQLQEERVAKATELAEKGNTEVLEEEKARLNEAQAERDRIAKKQLQLNAILQASNQAVALTEAIGAVVKAASDGDPYTIALRVAAAVAALVAGIASVSSAFQNVNQGYAKGVIDLDGAGTSTSDSINARLSKGESVMTAAETKAFKPYLQAMRNGTFHQMVNQRTPVFVTNTNDYRTLEGKLDGVIEAIGLSGTKVNARVDEHGVAIMTERYSRYNQNRFR